MGDLIVYFMENQPGWVIILGVVGFLAAEFLLDIVHDLVMDWIRRDKNV